MRKVAIIIVSYNAKKMMQECIFSIRETTKNVPYEIVVVDNHSTDGIGEWLTEQPDIKLIANKENAGFVKACNQGILAAENDADILLLNNDTLVMKDSIYWLRKGLYSDSLIGAAGSVSNCVTGYQQIEKTFDNLEQYKAFAENNNVAMDNPFEAKSQLVGFAMMIKREVLNKTGLLDERFSPGNFEDNDISIRIIQAGYRLILCKNSFIYHYGSVSFKKNYKQFCELLIRNHKKFVEKYDGIDFVKYNKRKTDLANLIQNSVNNPFRVLDIGCGLGSTLSYIKSKYPLAICKGIEKNKTVAEIGKSVSDIVWKDIFDDSILNENEAYDYIIIHFNIMTCENKGLLVDKVKMLLKNSGKIIFEVDNELYDLQKRDYEQEELLKDKFTAEKTILFLLSQNISVENLVYKKGVKTQGNSSEIKNTNIDEVHFQIEKYIFLCNIGH